MHVRALISLSVSLMTWTIATTTAHAEEGYQAPAGKKEKRVFVGLSAGGAYAMVNHPLINSTGFGSMTLGMHAGANITEQWAIGGDVTTFEHGMIRTSATDPFRPTQFLEPQAGCNNCSPPPQGGWISQTSATFTTVGPRVEFSPMGRDGLYLGLSTGLSVLLGIDTQFGFGGAARAGYRYRIGNVLGVGLEGGIQAQRFDTGSNLFPYASVVLRPYF